MLILIFYLRIIRIDMPQLLNTIITRLEFKDVKFRFNTIKFNILLIPAINVIHCLI